MLVLFSLIIFLDYRNKQNAAHAGFSKANFISKVLCFLFVASAPKMSSRRELNYKACQADIMQSTFWKWEAVDKKEF